MLPSTVLGGGAPTGIVGNVADSGSGGLMVLSGTLIRVVLVVKARFSGGICATLEVSQTITFATTTDCGLSESKTCLAMEKSDLMFEASFMPENQ